ncbi:MAG: hypothetical protein OEW63_05775 [Gammaproteobacteria bacterium]|nr:hypothetical protein [Gammaproteobacteria bacterium]
MRRFNLILCLLCFSLLGGCAQQKVVASDPDGAGLSRLAKSDINEVVELHQRAVMHDLKELMLKLYRRNPDGRHDKAQRTIEASVNRVFSRAHDQDYPQWQALKPTDIIRVALDETYQGSDRVLPFIVGLRKMLMTAYDNHTEFYYLTSLSEQKLYNSARNIEIAAWMLAENRDINGRLLILSDSLEHEQRNLSYQRLIGRMIATQDNLAAIISRKSGRLIKSVVVKAASMMFLPI